MLARVMALAPMRHRYATNLKNVQLASPVVALDTNARGTLNARTSESEAERLDRWLRVP